MPETKDEDGFKASVVATIVLLAASGLLATLAPALRAARVAPTIATRNV